MSDAIPPEVTSKGHEIGDLMANLARSFGQDLTILDPLVEDWCERFMPVASPILAAALSDYLEHGNGFPTADTFALYVDVAKSATQREVTHQGSCAGGCDRGMVPQPDVMRGNYRYTNQYRPCARCRPDLAEQAKVWAAQARRTAPIQPTDTLAFNASAIVARTRANLRRPA